MNIDEKLDMLLEINEILAMVEDDEDNVEGVEEDE